MSEQTLRRSSSSFFFDPHGHFGDKVQYNSRTTDQAGGSYTVHCRKGKAYAIEVKYPEQGVSIETANSVLRRLLASTAHVETARSDTDLKLKDTSDPWQFIYFDNKIRAELHYSSCGTRVRDLSVWTD